MLFELPFERMPSGLMCMLEHKTSLDGKGCPDVLGIGADLCSAV